MAPTTGTKHLQGAIVTIKQQRFSFFKTHISNEIHVETMEKHLIANQIYCRKSGNN